MCLTCNSKKIIIQKKKEVNIEYHCYFCDVIILRINLLYHIKTKSHLKNIRNINKWNSS